MPRRSFAVGALVLAFAMPALAQQANSNICIDPDKIRGVAIIDDQTILFRMVDGKFWQNKLRQTCPGLKAEDSFVYAIRGDTVCGNMQQIRVVRTGSVCTLGDFTQYGSEKPAPAW